MCIMKLSIRYARTYVDVLIYCMDILYVPVYSVTGVISWTQNIAHNYLYVNCVFGLIWLKPLDRSNRDSMQPGFVRQLHLANPR